MAQRRARKRGCRPLVLPFTRQANENCKRFRSSPRFQDVLRCTGFVCQRNKLPARFFECRSFRLNRSVNENRGSFGPATGEQPDRTMIDKSVHMQKRQKLKQGQERHAPRDVIRSFPRVSGPAGECPATGCRRQSCRRRRRHAKPARRTNLARSGRSRSASVRSRCR